ncbi:MetQ/NlpA family ABC transporter substrate-binding protein [Candidatus Phytoplasma prunorum]|uniref:MetQ/NlpA family ABC transporter substrate-binding protein n=1 Tax=Candidatus Phytoplasma prunorum TaxID=47565 RepID=UPI002FF17871
MSKLKKFIIKIKNMNNFKKIFFVFILLFISLLSYRIFTISNTNDLTRNIKRKNLKVSTALPNVEKILNSSCKNFLSKQNIDLEVQYLPGSFHETVNLVECGKSDAVISCHMPWILMNQKNEKKWSNIVPIQPFYIASFGIYKHQNIDLNFNSNLKVLIPDDDVNRTFALLYLKKYGLVELNDDNIRNESISFILSLENLKSNSKLNKNNFECISYGQIEQAFQKRVNNNYQYSLAVNFPSFMKDYNDEKINSDNHNFSNTIKNDNFLFEDKEFNIFAITLMSRKNNQDNEEIKYLKESLKQDEIVKFYNENCKHIGIIIYEEDKIKDIINNIKNIKI